MYQALVLLASVALILLDQFTKLLALAFLQDGPFVIIPGVLEFHFTTNPGVAFGLFPGNRWIFIGLTSVVLLAILVILLSGKVRQHRMVTISGILIIAGGMGNLIDRIFRHEVVDFIYFKLIDFPIFNLADCFVVAGAVLLLVFYLSLYNDEKAVKEPAAAAEKTETAEGEASNEDGTPAPSGGEDGGKA